MGPQGERFGGRLGNAQLGLLELPRPFWVRKDLSVAFQWYRKAAIWGCPQQCAAWACVTRTVGGVGKGPSAAVEWYRKASDQGEAVAMNSLGKCYFNGLGVGKNLSVAFEWYRKAAAEDRADARDGLRRSGVRPYDAALARGRRISVLLRRCAECSAARLRCAYERGGLMGPVLW
jgi:TPR repeat protein